VRRTHHRSTHRPRQTHPRRKQIPFEVPAATNWHPPLVGPGGHLPHLQRRLLRHRRRRLDAPRTLRDALAWPHPRRTCSLASPEVHGLVALMEIQASRTAARVNSAGEPILILEQNRYSLEPRNDYPRLTALHPRRNPQRRKRRAIQVPTPCKRQSLPATPVPLPPKPQTGPDRSPLRGTRPPRAIPNRGTQPRRSRSYG